MDVYGVDTSGYGDVILRVLDESTLGFEDSNNEQWQNMRALFPPKRWTMLQNLSFTTIPPQLPSTLPPDPLWPTDPSKIFVRVDYVKRAAQVANPLDPIDPSIPDYYQEALRYAAVAYLMEMDTDLKSVQLKKEMMESFMAHMAGGVDKLASGEVDQ
jgi:hypothetical protein